MKVSSTSLSKQIGLATAALGLGLGLAAMGSAPARAAFPDHTMTGIIPFTVGGLSDTTGRIVATFLGQKLGQQIVVENKGGAGGNVGIGVALQAKPDGYTLLMSSIAMTTNPALYKQLSWDPKTVVPVALVTTIPTAIAVNTKKFPKGNLQDLIAAIKANPGKFNFASSDSTIDENLFRLVTDTKIEIVNYSGSGDAVTSLVNGETDVATTGVQPLIPMLGDGKIRILALTGPTRVEALPDVPTTTEAGLPAYQPISYFGIYVPAGTPSATVTFLNAKINEVMSNPDVVQRLKILGATARVSTIKEATDFFNKDIATWKNVVAKSGIPQLD